MTAYRRYRLKFALIVLLTPVFLAGAIGDEKSRGSLQFLLITDLNAWEILASGVKAAGLRGWNTSEDAVRDCWRVGFPTSRDLCTLGTKRIFAARCPQSDRESGRSQRCILSGSATACAHARPA